MHFCFRMAGGAASSAAARGSKRSAKVVFSIDMAVMVHTWPTALLRRRGPSSKLAHVIMDGWPRRKTIESRQVFNEHRCHRQGLQALQSTLPILLRRRGSGQQRSHVGFSDRVDVPAPERLFDLRRRPSRVPHSDLLLAWG